VIAFPSEQAWEDWLAAHHASADGIWMKIAKKASGIPTVTHPEALNVALCYGWIDGQRKPLDGRWFLQRWTPRRARSRWSKVNCAKAEALEAAGRMLPPGRAEIERAQADGRWDAAYDAQSVATVPADLQRAFDANPAARDFFATLRGSNRYSILYRIHEAKRPETRARRIEQFVAMLADGKTLYP
jgi:uncharacterized protein YdeI (YjbR/CyaY-like superfamily)